MTADLSNAASRTSRKPVCWSDSRVEGSRLKNLKLPCHYVSHVDRNPHATLFFSLLRFTQHLWGVMVRSTFTPPGGWAENPKHVATSLSPVTCPMKTADKNHFPFFHWFGLWLVYTYARLLNLPLDKELKLAAGWMKFIYQTWPFSSCRRKRFVMNLTAFAGGQLDLSVYALALSILALLLSLVLSWTFLGQLWK